jgi:hypothetical protein
MERSTTMRLQCQRGSHGCGRAMLIAIFSHAADRSGLSEGQFEFKSFTIIVARTEPDLAEK